jgi:monofunctional biosynthetic peptidoglycan transglycosylase
MVLKFFNPPITSFIQNELTEGKLISIFPEKSNQNWVSIDEISNKMVLAVIASEDQKFFDHWGFDVEQIMKAVDENDNQIRMRGASTITQQAAKNLFLSSSKNYIRKGFEAYYTFLIELLWTKKRIIEVYLNIAEMGPQTYGVSAAASYHFNKTAKMLNSDEAAYLAAILPNPSRYKKNFRTNYINRRLSGIKEQMIMMGGESFLRDNF